MQNIFYSVKNNLGNEFREFMNDRWKGDWNLHEYKLGYYFAFLYVLKVPFLKVKKASRKSSFKINFDYNRYFIPQKHVNYLSTLCHFEEQPGCVKSPNTHLDKALSCFF